MNTSMPAKPAHLDQRYGRAVLEGPTPERVNNAMRWQAEARARRFGRAMRRAETQRRELLRVIGSTIELFMIPQIGRIFEVAE